MIERSSVSCTSWVSCLRRLAREGSEAQVMQSPSEAEADAEADGVKFGAVARAAAIDAVIGAGALLIRPERPRRRVDRREAGHRIGVDILAEDLRNAHAGAGIVEAELALAEAAVAVAAP